MHFKDVVLYQNEKGLASEVRFPDYVRFPSFYADIYDMSDLTLFSILHRVISDYRVIAAFAAVLIYLNFVFYVARYKKRKGGGAGKRLVKIKTAAPAPAPTPAPVPEAAETGSGTDEGDAQADMGE